MSGPPKSTDERASRLPLITETATVTAVDAVDERRTDEIRAAVERYCEEWGLDPPPEPIDWGGFIDGVPDSVPNTVTDDLATLRQRAEREYPSLVRVELAPEAPIDFAPGQYATIRFQDVPRPYSLANSPNDDTFELCIRRVLGGHLSSRLFENLQPGDVLPELRGPSGDFTLRDPSERDIVFLATGTGVSPLRSMIQYTFEENRDEYEGTTRDVWLFHGCSWRDDLAFAEEFDRLEKERDNFHYVPTLSRENILSTWEGETDYVQYAFVKHLDDDVDPGAVDENLVAALADDPVHDPGVRIDPRNVDVYACGVTAMVATLEDVATSVGVPDLAVRGEGFG